MEEAAKGCGVSLEGYGKGDLIKLRFCRRLKEKAENRFARPVIYVALGDSVTQGFQEHNPSGSPIYHEDADHAKFRRLVHAHIPGTSCL